MIPKIGPYKILAQIDVGGMAQILLAHDETNNQKPIVIKKILPHLSKDKRFLHMFLDEAQLTSHLDHPNIIKTYDLQYDNDEQPYLVMEYLEGKSISELIGRLIQRQRIMNYGLCAHVIAECAAGLHAAHELKDSRGHLRQVVHRDISPANIFVQYDGTVKVLDFGIATATERLSQTEAGQIKGKYAYMSPEQCMGKPLDRRSDIFSLGIVLYELSTCRRLFKRKSDMATMQAVCHDPILPIAFHEAYPEALKHIILKATAKSPDERYLTALALQTALNHVSHTLCKDPLQSSLSIIMRGLFPTQMDKETSFHDKANDHTFSNKSWPQEDSSKDVVIDLDVEGSSLSLQLKQNSIVHHPIELESIAGDLELPSIPRPMPLPENPDKFASHVHSETSFLLTDAKSQSLIPKLHIEQAEAPSFHQAPAYKPTPSKILEKPSPFSFTQSSLSKPNQSSSPCPADNSIYDDMDESMSPNIAPIKPKNQTQRINRTPLGILALILSTFLGLVFFAVLDSEKPQREGPKEIEAIQNATTPQKSSDEDGFVQEQETAFIQTEEDIQEVDVQKVIHTLARPTKQTQIDTLRKPQSRQTKKQPLAFLQKQAAQFEEIQIERLRKATEASITVALPETKHKTGGSSSSPHISKGAQSLRHTLRNIDQQHSAASQEQQALKPQAKQKKQPVWHHSAQIQNKASPYIIQTGSVIPSIMNSGINSDLSGQIVAHTAAHIYDSPTGQHLLIPQGSKLFGTYSNQVNFGQSRLMVIWQRIIFTNGQTYTLPNSSGITGAGYTGLQDKIDRHIWRTFAAAFLTSIIQLGTPKTPPAAYPSTSDALGSSAQEGIRQTSQGIIDRNLNVAPTLEIRPGYRFNVLVNKDLILKPYGEEF